MTNKYEGLDIATLEVTLKCQLRCPGCYMNKKEVQRRDTKNDMGLKTAVKILDLCKEYKGSELKEAHILGGEPLKWKFLKEFIIELNKRKIIPHIYTNMLNIDKSLAKWLYKKNVKITGKLNINPNCNKEIGIQAELIGSNTKTAKKMISNIRVLQKAGYNKKNLSLNNLIRKSNLNSIPGFYKWCILNNINPDLELMGSGTGKTDPKITPSANELAELILKLQKARKELNLKKARLALPHIFSGCDHCEHQLYFNVDGNIKPCSSDGLRIISNINNKDPIKKAMESKEVLSRVNRKRKDFAAPCDICKQWDFCKGGCAATRQAIKDKIIGCPVEILIRNKE